MSVSAYTIINAVLAVLILGGIFGLLIWSILTQHRHAGCEDVRLRRRHLGIGVKRVPLPPTVPASRVEAALEG